ncbi:MAG TPA: spore coat protein CotH [Clostridiaceae bacterium]|nr:spore coat protein CotH [Clostridiaceae bacterium]
MLKHKHIDKIIIAILIVASFFTMLFLNGNLGILPAGQNPGYEYRLFDDSRVHDIKIYCEQWDEILADPRAELYKHADIEIDGERFNNVGFRTKGNNSLRLTHKYGSERYSFKIEFDHYVAGSYYGLDKLSLDSSFQDNSYLKAYITYDMMTFMGVPSPLTSYVWLTINDQARGLYLAIEEPEEGFARRNFGANHGQLYKPDYKKIDAENADVALRYIDDNPESYDNIFRKAKFKPTEQDKKRLIRTLEILSTGENLTEAVDVDSVLRFFPPQVFVVNLDGYLGKNGHNYFLYEENGIISMLPWDYNLAFGTYSLGMPDPINDAELYINHPIITPAAGEIMFKRPLYHNLMKNPEYFTQYKKNFDYLIREYFESGHFSVKVAETVAMISPYVEKDPTAFCSFEDFFIGVQTFTDFCLLRAESIRGQLDGTIPATIAGQADAREKNLDIFIDGSDVWLPDMGEVADLKD